MSRKQFIRKKDIPVEYYQSCDTLMLYNFIKIVVTKNIRQWLTISGYPSDEQLSDAWNKINESYQDLTEDTDGDYLLGLFTSISMLEGKLAIIYNILAYLEINRSEGLIQVLQDEFGYYYEFSEESIEIDIKSIISELKLDQVNLDLQNKELKEFQGKGKAPNEFDYDSILSTLSKYQGYHIRSKDITVTEFIAILNRFKHENNPIKNESPQEVD